MGNPPPSCPPPPTFPRFPKMLDRAVSRPPSSCTSLDDDECSFLPFSKREYLLAQMRQKDELIDSLLKQVRLSHILLRNMCAFVHHVIPSLTPQLHNPYLATPLSIEAYRNATSTADQHRQNVIAWLDRLQASVRSPRPTGSASNPFQLETRAGKSAGQSDESDEEQGSQNHAQPRRASSGSEDTPVSPNTLVDSEIDPYPDDAVPIGLLASLAISSSRDSAGAAADKTSKAGKANAAAEDDDIVRLYSFSMASQTGNATDEGVFCL